MKYLNEKINLPIYPSFNTRLIIKMKNLSNKISNVMVTEHVQFDIKTYHSKR